MIIGLTGRIAAGKETLTEFLRKKGFIYIETSKILNKELEKRGLEITRKNQQDVGDECVNDLAGGTETGCGVGEHHGHGPRKRGP